MAYVAFLRGIMPSNPNMRNEKLRGVFEGLGFSNVRSVISSGNIIFETDELDITGLEATIEQALKKELGINSTTIIRSQRQLQVFVDSRPFGDRVHSRETYLTITFLKHKPAKEPKQHTSADGLFEIIAYDPKLFGICAATNVTAIKTPDFMTWLEKQHGKDITTRTYKTVERILKKL